MKVVLFCGGQGMRLRGYNNQIPKPMMMVGYRPILWYLMKYYAYFGHKDFILLLGYKADVIKDYFVNYHEYISNDFVLSKGGKKLSMINTDISDWTITFLDTGINANVGDRLLLAKEHLKSEEMFFANYADGLTDLPLNIMLNQFKASKCTGIFMACQPNLTFHFAYFNEKNQLEGIHPAAETGLFINAGYFIFRNTIFDYLKKGEELVEEPFKRMIKDRKLMAYKYNGFWRGVDTFKDKHEIDDLYKADKAPWKVWNN
jgi:glucose-1-phosphate cytidylyltransferase